MPVHDIRLVYRLPNVFSIGQWLLQELTLVLECIYYAAKNGHGYDNTRKAVQKYIVDWNWDVYIDYNIHTNNNVNVKTKTETTTGINTHSDTESCKT